MERKNRKLKVVIVILVVLICLSGAALTGTLLYKHFVQTEPTTVDVPGNVITPDGEDSFVTETNSDSAESANTANGETISELNTSTSPDQSETTSASESAPGSTDSETTGTTSVSGTKASAIALHNRKSEDNTPFQVTNMFPGDRETKYYCVKVSYKGDIVVRCHADIRPGYEKLAEVLKVKIRLLHTDEILYDGLMRDMPKSLNYELYTTEKKQSELYYEISAYLDTSVGNEYQDKELIADLRWWVEEAENLDSPQTGDDLYIYLWFALAVGSLFVLIILLAMRRKESADEH